MKHIIEQDNLLEVLRKSDYFNIPIEHGSSIVNFKNVSNFLIDILKELDLSHGQKNMVTKGSDPITEQYARIQIKEVPRLYLSTSILTKSEEELKQKKNLFFDNVVKSFSLTDKYGNEIMTVYNKPDLVELLNEIEKDITDQKYIKRKIKKDPSRALDFWDNMKKSLRKKYAHLRADLIK